MSMKVNVVPDEYGKLPVIVTNPAWAVTNDSAANTAVTVTKAAIPNGTHYITAFSVVISGAAAANDLTIQIQDGTTTIWKDVIGSGAPRGNSVGAVFTFPLVLTAGNAANIVVSAGGAGVVATANLSGYTV